MRWIVAIPIACVLVVAALAASLAALFYVFASESASDGWSRKNE